MSKKQPLVDGVGCESANLHRVENRNWREMGGGRGHMGIWIIRDYRQNDRVAGGEIGNQAR